MTDNNSYQKRIVSYEKIHSIDEKDFDSLIAIVDPKNGESILDVCCGYGSVSKKILQEIDKKGLDSKIILLDNSELQLERAKENLKNNINIEFVLSDAIQTPFPENYFDTVVNKMGLHEVDKESQYKMIKEFYRIIKPSGKIVIWELALDDKTQPIFSEIIKKKDQIAGFHSFVRNRYFPKKDDVLIGLKDSGFENPKVEHNVFPSLSIRNRKEELISVDRLNILGNKGFVDESEEFNLQKTAEDKVEELRRYIREKLSEEEKILMGFSESEDDTILKAPKAIFKALKPL